MEILGKIVRQRQMGIVSADADYSGIGLASRGEKPEAFFSAAS
jgi:hypothetical protein